MGKKAKEHRKKVAKRNKQIDEQKKKNQKNAMNYLLKLIQKEKESGAFNNPVQPLPNGSMDPITQNTNNLSGPQI